MIKTESQSDDLQFEEEAEVEDDEKGPAVLKSEILAAVSEIKQGKAVGAGEVPVLHAGLSHVLEYPRRHARVSLGIL